MRNLSPFLISLILVLGARCTLASEGAPLPQAPAKPAQASQGFPRERLILELSGELSRHFTLEGELQVEPQRTWKEPEASTSPWVLTMLEFPAQLASNILVRIRLDSPGHASVDATLPLRVQHWRDAFVCREPTVREAEFDSSTLDLRRVDALQDRDAVFSGGLDGTYTFSRSVPAGRLLTWRDLSRRSLVRKGDVVEVQAVDGPLMITMKAMAMQNGASGELVTVRNIESRRDIHARVVGERRVEVRF